MGFLVMITLICSEQIGNMLDQEILPHQKAKVDLPIPAFSEYPVRDR